MTWDEQGGPRAPGSDPLLRRKRAAPVPEHRLHEFWSGIITFGLVSVPVQLIPSHHNGGVALRELAPDGTPLRRRFFCPYHEKVVDAGEIIKGFEYESDRYVVVTQQELDGLQPQKSREIDLRLFVPLADISPVYFERSYFLGPEGDSSKAYRLLAQVLEKSVRAAIAHVRDGRSRVRDRDPGRERHPARGDIAISRCRPPPTRRDRPGPGGEGRSTAQGTSCRPDRDAHKSETLLTGKANNDYSERIRALVNRKAKQGKDVVTAEDSRRGTRADREGRTWRRRPSRDHSSQLGSTKSQEAMKLTTYRKKRHFKQSPASMPN